MKFKLESWPVPEGIPARLYWIKSPRQVGESDQWTVKVLFIDENGIKYSFNAPWGFLPNLRLGGTYVDGCLSNNPAAGVETTIQFCNDNTCSVISAENIEHEWTAAIREVDNRLLWEKCVKITYDEDKLLILPCIEVARSLFAITSKMSHLLLEPFGINSICSSHIENKRLKIDFNEEVAFSALNDLLVSRIAMILHQSEWNHCWRQVWNETEKNSHNNKVYLKLLCYPPIAKDAKLRVRGFHTQQGFLVLEILGLQSKVELPFSEIIWTHPGLKTTEKDPSSGEAGDNTENSKKAGTRGEVGEIDPDPVDPKGMGKPHLETIVVAKIEFGNDIKITKERTIRETSPGGRKKGTIGSPEETSQDIADEVPAKPIKVSLNDEGRNGDMPSADFKPIESLINIPTELEKFIIAAGKISGANVGCIIKPIPSKSKLRKHTGKPRNYALVYVATQKQARYVLEIDPSTGNGISTMIFSPSEGKVGVDTAEKLLVDCVTSAGNWDLAAIETGIVKSYELVKHVASNNKPEKWGRRLLAAVAAIAGKV